MNLQNSVDKSKSTFYIFYGKRIFDLALALLALIVLSPVFFIAALLVRTQLGSSVFFKQIRPGLHEKPFVIFKFRTMTSDQGKDGKMLPDAQRLTRLGSFLRKTSIDELPGLFNVLKGEMTLVGPRPLLMQYLDHYTSEQARRHEVKPGITGWAQVNGRNAITWEKKFKLDVWYVDNRSLWLDVKIIFMTIWKIIKREGISQSDQATVEEFRGNSDECK